MKKNKLFYILFVIIAISICASPPFALKQLYIGEDMLYHILRIKEMSNNILNGNIFPYIHSGALDGYGYASAFFYPELTLIIPALFYIMGFDIVNSINISIVIYNVIAGVVAYLCLNIFLKDVLKKGENIAWLSLIGSLAYIVYPYRLYNIFYRGALNEFIAMCFIPLSLLAMYKVFFRKEFKYWKMLSVSFSLTLLTHLGTTLMLGIVGVIFFILNVKLILNKEFIKSMLKAIICSILATSYFLFPMIEQMLSNEFFYTTLPKLNNINIYPNETIDKKALILIGNSLSQPVLILFNILLVFLLVSIYKKLLSRVKNRKWIIVISSVLIFIYIFIMQTDIFPWEAVTKIFPVILKVQFPFRFFALVGLLFSFIIALSIPVLDDKNKYIKGVIIIFMMISPSLMLTDSLMSTLSVDKDDLNKVDITWCLGFGEYLPSKIKPEYEKYLKERGNTININYKNGVNESIKRDSSESHTEYLIDNNKGNIESVEFPLVYYKGYDVKNNKNNIEIKESSNGFVEIKNIPKDIVDIDIYYKGTMIQDISNLISIVFLFLIIPFNKMYKRKGVYKCVRG